MPWLGLLFWIVLCFLVAWASGRWTGREVRGWYRTLARPGFTPPDWVFGPVWTVLYALMAFAAWLVWLTSPSAMRTAGLALFFVQLALNFAWSWIFFRRHAIGAALVEVLVLWLAIGATTLLFSRVDLTAAWLMLPYWAWVSFASILNAALWRLNRRHPTPPLAWPPQM